MSITDTTLAEAEILLAQPRGFCAGVDRAIEIVERAIKLYGSPIYVRHEIVHNAYVVEDLRKKGAIFIEQLEEVPSGSTVIFSAHGVSKAVRAEADERGLRVYDATCPLVTKVHIEVAKMRAEGFDIVMIGHKGHPEVEGTMGQTAEGMYLVEDIADVQALQLADPDRIAYVTQTTLSVDDAAQIIAALKAKYPNVKEPKKQDICYATQNRQDAVKAMAPHVDMLLVLGAPNSSNSLRLCEVAAARNPPAHHIEPADDIRDEWLDGVTTLGLTASASAPEILVKQVVDYARDRLGVRSVEEFRTVTEDVRFSLPHELTAMMPADA